MWRKKYPHRHLQRSAEGNHAEFMKLQRHAEISSLQDSCAEHGCGPVGKCLHSMQSPGFDSNPTRSLTDRYA